MDLSILSLPGDGIGIEVTREAEKVLRAVLEPTGHRLELERGLIGAEAIRKTGSPLPDDTLALARRTQATLLGAVGSPEFDRAPPSERPEAGLLRLRKALGVYANLRPVRTYPSVSANGPLRPDLAEGTDLIVVRELCGGLYYGTPRGIEGEGRSRRATNTLTYDWQEIERTVRVAFNLARSRRRKLTSVDKANVLETSQLWRSVVIEVASQYSDVGVDHLLVDNAAMQLIREPKRFDVLVTENLFGDILSDEAAVIAGSIGLLPSASLGEVRASGHPVGLYEPIHGSAPDLAGQNKANPIGAIGSVAMLLEHSFGLKREAASIQKAIGRVIERGIATADLGSSDKPHGTSEVGDAVVRALAEAA